jgi:hypothetical protein
MTDTSLTTPSNTLRQLNTPEAVTLVNLSAAFEDLQTVLRCCERLVSALKPGDGSPDDLLIEALWTTALISYARCFSSGDKDACLTEEDLTGTELRGDVLDWHRVLLKLRGHYTSTNTNPRELFSIGIAQNAEGAASGVAITSARQPLVEDRAVRQTGAVALTLSDMLNDRISAQQGNVFGEWKDASTSELDRLPRREVIIAD